MNKISISDKYIGNGERVFIVAELSCNHLQNFDLAVKTIEAAKKAGADAIKVQTNKPEILTLNCDNQYFQIKAGSLWDGQTLYDLYKKIGMPWEWHRDLQKLANEIGLIFFSSPVDKSSVDFLEELNVPAYKIPSFEIVDIPLVKYIASKNKPIILSTGIAELIEIKDAITACRNIGNDQIIILKCTSLYPPSLDELNLKTIPDLKKRFNVIVGLSDHSLELNPIISSVALGAKMIEKHIILDRKLGGPDAEFSLNPDEFKKMVIEIRKTEKSLGKVNYKLSDKLKKNRVFIRSLFVVEDIKKGEEFNDKNVKSIRPGYGLSPKYIDDILNKRAKINIKKGTPLSWDLIDE